MAHRRRYFGQCSGYVAVHHSAILADCLANDALQLRERKIVRNIPDFLYVRGFELGPSRRGESRQLANAVFRNGMAAGAMRVVLTLVRCEAVPARRNVRCCLASSRSALRRAFSRRIVLASSVHREARFSAMTYRPWEGFCQFVSAHFRTA